MTDYSLYNGGYVDPAPVREHMDSGVLSAMLEKYETKLLSGDPGEFLREPGYIFMLLGACAMTLGCKIPATFRHTMEQVYMCVGLPSEGVKQMERALKGPDAYEDGVPYDFASPGLIETANLKHSLQTGPPPSGAPWHGLNVHGPGTMFYQPPKGDTSGLRKLKARYEAKINDEKYGADVCGGCGAEDGEKGVHLRNCARCMGRKYCSKECQKKQWPLHKEVCGDAKGKGTV